VCGPKQEAGELAAGKVVPVIRPSQPTSMLDCPELEALADKVVRVIRLYRSPSI